MKPLSQIDLWDECIVTPILRTNSHVKCQKKTNLANNSNKHIATTQAINKQNGEICKKPLVRTKAGRDITENITY